MTLHTIIITSLISLKSFTIGNELNIHLTVPETNTVMKALHTASMPYDESYPVIDKILSQVIPQLNDTSQIKK